MAQLLLLTGPSGAGKTTVAKEFLKHAEGEWAYISQDSLRQLVVAGYVSADDYEHTWSSAVRRQWDVSIPICVDIARHYLSVGINCVIDFYAPPDEFKKWRVELGDLSCELVIIRPDLKTTLSRNARRDTNSRLKDKKVVTNHAAFSAWSHLEAHILDTSLDTVQQTVKRIEKIIS